LPSLFSTLGGPSHRMIHTSKKPCVSVGCYEVPIFKSKKQLVISEVNFRESNYKYV